MSELTRIDFEGNVYYYYNNLFLDENFVQLDQNTQKKVADYFFGKVDYKTMSPNDLKLFLIKIKNSESYTLAITVAEFLLDNYGALTDISSTTLSILCSSYRLLKLPNKAIEQVNKYFEKYPMLNKSKNSALYTSLAAAYCDIKEYNLAKQYANKAYMINKSSESVSGELNALYARLKSEAGDLF